MLIGRERQIAVEKEQADYQSQVSAGKQGSETGVPIWADPWFESGFGTMNTDMSAFMWLSPNKDLKNGLIRAESVFMKDGYAHER